MNYTFKYGLKDSMIDITNICLTRLLHNNIILIPQRDIMVKQVLRKSGEMFDTSEVPISFIHIYENNTLFYDSIHEDYMCIDFDRNMMYIGIGNVPENIVNNIYNSSCFEHKLWYIQSQLKLDTGFFYEEYSEQLMATQFLTGNEKVLELGGNIGRNSLVISYILNKCNNTNFVTLETNKMYCDVLAFHRDTNNLHFHIENSALSNRKLIQKDWTTIPSDIVLEGWSNVNTITFDELCRKYDIEFDTLIIDCEGAFFQILLDMRNILTNIKTIIMENDYTETWQKQCVDYILQQNGFKVVQALPLGLPIEWVKCVENFYEVWKK